MIIIDNIPLFTHFDYQMALLMPKENSSALFNLNLEEKQKKSLSLPPKMWDDLDKLNKWIVSDDIAVFWCFKYE